MAAVTLAHLGDVRRDQMAALALSTAEPPAINVNLPATALAPFDAAKSNPATLDLTGLFADVQARAKAAIEALCRKIRMFPDFDHKAALAATGAATQATATSSGEVTAAAPVVARRNVIRR